MICVKTITHMCKQHLWKGTQNTVGMGPPMGESCNWRTRELRGCYLLLYTFSYLLNLMPSRSTVFPNIVHKKTNEKMCVQHAVLLALIINVSKNWYSCLQSKILQHNIRDDTLAQKAAWHQGEPGLHPYTAPWWAWVPEILFHLIPVEPKYQRGVTPSPNVFYFVIRLFKYRKVEIILYSTPIYLHSKPIYLHSTIKISVLIIYPSISPSLYSTTTHLTFMHFKISWRH